MPFAGKALSIAGLVLLTVPAAFARALPESVAACSDERNDRARLACFDREVARFKQHSAPVASAQLPPAQPVVPPSPVADTQRDETKAKADEFGVSGQLARRRKQQEKDVAAPREELHAVVARVFQKPYGELVFELDNGQVWEQPEKKYVLSIKGGEKVHITRGAVGSYFLTADSGATTRVRRVR